MRYFSMFTGIGGFEIGIKQANKSYREYLSEQSRSREYIRQGWNISDNQMQWDKTEQQEYISENNSSRSSGNVECNCEEKAIRDSERDKSISEGYEGQLYNKTDSRNAESFIDSSGTLFQDRCEQGNTFSDDMGQDENDIEIRRQIRQTSERVLRERDGIRDDEESLQSGKGKPNFKEWECIGYSEIDRHAIGVFERHFPDIKNYGDATKIVPEELPDFDMLCGGFPCQSFSIAGKRQGFQDTRGTLFHEVLRIVEVKRPRFIFLENVKGLLSIDNGRCFHTIITSLQKLGYNIEWEVLNSKYFGVPQNRERVFIIGHLRGTPSRQVFPIGQGSFEIDKTPKQVSSAIHAGYYKQGGRDQQYIPVNATYRHPMEGFDGYDDMSPAIKSSQGSGNQIIVRPIALDLYNNKAHTDRTPALTEPHHNNLRMMVDNRIRRLTPVECERLQGFPDDWTRYDKNGKEVSDTQRYKMCGNAVTTNVIQAIVEKLIWRTPNET